MTPVGVILERNSKSAMGNSSDEKIVRESMKIAEEFFGTHQDPDQIPISQESHDKLLKLHPRSVIYKLIDEKLVAWIVVVPTISELMNKFISGEITERELFNLTEPQKSYDALYLCSSFVLPEYRRKGYAIELFLKAIKDISQNKKIQLFAWPFSKEGQKLAKKLKQTLNTDILIRK